MPRKKRKNTEIRIKKAKEKAERQEERERKRYALKLNIREDKKGIYGEIRYIKFGRFLGIHYYYEGHTIRKVPEGPEPKEYLDKRIKTFRELIQEKRPKYVFVTFCETSEKLKEKIVNSLEDLLTKLPTRSAEIRSKMLLPLPDYFTRDVEAVARVYNPDRNI